MIVFCQRCKRKGNEGWIHQTCVECCEILDPGMQRYKEAIKKVEEK